MEMLISYYEKHTPDLVSLWGLFLPPETWLLGCTAIQFRSDAEGESKRSSHLFLIVIRFSLEVTYVADTHNPQAPWPVTARAKSILLLSVHEGMENQSWVSSARYHGGHKQGTSVCLLVLTVWLRWPQNPHLFLEPQSLNVWFLLIVALEVGLHCAQ